MNRGELQYKIVMHFGRINSPSLDLACPQAITELGKPVHKLESEVSIKEYGQEASRFLTKPNYSQQQPQIIRSL